MYEMFDEVFEEVMDEMGYEVWYELVESDDWEVVRERISERLGHDCDDDDDFNEWESDMFNDI